MPVSSSYIDFVKDLFAPFGMISVRKMFGGAGIYCDGKIFAIIGDDDIYFKADELTKAEFVQAGCEPFTIEMNGKTGSMSYFSAPEDIFEDPQALQQWTDLALAAAARGALKKRKPVKRKKRSD